MNCDILYLVVPCYNEQQVLPETARRLEAKLGGVIAAGTGSPKSRGLLAGFCSSMTAAGTQPGS